MWGKCPHKSVLNKCHLCLFTTTSSQVTSHIPPQESQEPSPGTQDFSLCPNPQAPPHAPRLCARHSPTPTSGPFHLFSGPHTLSRFSPSCPSSLQLCSNAVLPMKPDMSGSPHPNPFLIFSLLLLLHGICNPVPMIWGLTACLLNQNASSSPACCSALRAKTRDWNKCSNQQGLSIYQACLLSHFPGQVQRGQGKTTQQWTQAETHCEENLDEPV